LISLRRLGKTALTHHLLHELPSGWKGIFIDILETDNLEGFANILATSIANAFPRKSSPGKKFWEFIQTLRPVISFDPLTGSPQVSLEMRPSEAQNNISSVLDFLEKSDYKIVVAIDEFQQIMNYPEKNMDAWFRTRMQRLRNVYFIFSGSQQQIMSGMFSSPGKPFYRSSSIVMLGKIPAGEYTKFIIATFKKHKKIISPEIVAQILEWTDLHTFYVQQLCNRVFAATQTEATEELWKREAYMLLKENEPAFYSYRNMLTTSQWKLLKAIASEGKLYAPTAAAFLRKHQLETSASVLRALDALQRDELVYKTTDESGKNYYCVYDLLFRRWCRGK
jgi:DNA-binding MarR family transcriptional regulator